MHDPEFDDRHGGQPRAARARRVAAVTSGLAALSLVGVMAVTDVHASTPPQPSTGTRDSFARDGGGSFDDTPGQDPVPSTTIPPSSGGGGSSVPVPTPRPHTRSGGS